MSTTYVVLILYPKTNIFRLTFTRVIEIEIPTHPPLAAQKKLIIKRRKTMKKFNIETIKTIIITILITAIVAFIGGMQYQKNQTEQVKTEAATIVKNVKVEVSKQ